MTPEVLKSQDLKSQDLTAQDRSPELLTPASLQASILHRDAMMLIINKPAGIAVHRGPKGGACLEDYFDALRFGLPRPPALAHRLDRDTSGCLVLGRHRKALEALGNMFKQGAISKTYWAVVEGGPEAEEGLIDLPLGRLDATRGWWMKVDTFGLKSQTRWRVMGRGADADGKAICWLALEPLTGRTHQLRVHCEALGFPIVGDPIYGSGAREGAPGLQLHARAIVVPMAKHGDPVRVAAPAPAHMREALRACGWSPDQSAPG